VVLVKQGYIPFRMRQGSVLFYVEPGGRITLASDRGRKVLRELGHRAPSSVEDDLGVSFARLADAARDGVRLPTLLGFVEVDALVDPSGKSAGILVRADELASRNRGRADDTFTILLGEDPALRAAVELAEGYAKTDLPILIVAEPGAGGLKLAHWVHAMSKRSDQPLHDVDGASLTLPIFENETLKQVLPGTTLFIRSIEAMTEGAQRQLARELDGGELGEVRLIAWSSVEVRGRSGFSHELARLMRASTVALPPLRERSDRLLIAERMLEAVAPGSSLSAAAKRYVDAYAFPGNLSELEVALQRASAHAGERRVIEPEDLPAEIVDGSRSHGGTMESAERTALEEAMRLSGGNLSRAAKRLGIARTTLYRMMKKHRVVA
jgi:transcriptional regulator of acetoin/glycerol metabolism